MESLPMFRRAEPLRAAAILAGLKRETLKDVLAVYREAQVEPQDQGLLLRTSRPPIARRNPVVAG